MSFKSSLLLSLLTLALSFNVHAGQDKMIFAVDVIRHGDRTPVSEVPNSPYPWPQGLGQLTAKGMQQEFQLGQTLHKRYMQDAHLLPARYQAETMYVRSSDFDRTLMSAESLLLGLYPLGTGPQLSGSHRPAMPAAYQPIPIHTIPMKQDSLLVADSDRDKFKALLKQYVFPQAEWKQKTAELQAQFARFSQLSGMSISNLMELNYLGDNLYIRQLYHLPLPKGLTQEEAKTIIDAGRGAFAEMYKVRAMGRATGQELLKTIAAYLEEARQKKTPLKFVLFSSHDSTIMSLMSAMEAPLDTPPHYASDLNFALYEMDSGEYVVKLTLNNEPVKLPACGGKVCKLSQFEAMVKNG